MVLRVDFDRFAEEVKTRLLGEPVYVSSVHGGTLATAGNAQMVILAKSRAQEEEVTKKLEASKLKVFRGLWGVVLDDLEIEFEPIFVSAVAYRSEAAVPGIWLDAHHTEPQQPEILRRMYEEFLANGEIRDVSFEDFVIAMNPNVVVLSPAQLQRFADRNDPEPTIG